MTTYTAHEILGGTFVIHYGRDWIDTATGEVVYAGGLSV